MAQIGYIQIDENNIMVGWHSDVPSELPNGHSLTNKVTKEDPIGLLGLPDSDIDIEPSKRVVLGEKTVKELLRLELLAISNELDLMARMSEDTTTLQANFDTKKSTYQGLP